MRSFPVIVIVVHWEPPFRSRFLFFSCSESADPPHGKCLRIRHINLIKLYTDILDPKMRERGHSKNTPTDPCALPKSHREDIETRGGVASQEHHPSFSTKTLVRAWCKTPNVHHASAHDVPPIDGIGLTSTEATSGTPRGSFPPPPSSKRNTLPQVKGRTNSTFHRTRNQIQRSKA